MTKRLVWLLLLALAASSLAARAQEAGQCAAAQDDARCAPAQNDPRSAAAMENAARSAALLDLASTAAPLPAVTLSAPLAAETSSSASLTAMTPAPLAAAPRAPAPKPEPRPRFVYGSRDDYRWQLGFGMSFVRFRSSIFYATALGTDTSLTHFTNEWFAVEGHVTTAFAPTIYAQEHVKYLGYGGGPKIVWRRAHWEPWAHAIFGGAHLMPQTAGNSKNAFALMLGMGADYRVNPRFSLRLEANWLRTSFFQQTQNNGQLAASFVFHF